MDTQIVSKNFSISQVSSCDTKKADIESQMARFD